MITAGSMVLFVAILVALEMPRGRGKPYTGRSGYRRCSYCGLLMRLPLVASHSSFRRIWPSRILVCHSCWYDTTQPDRLGNDINTPRPTPPSTAEP
jgi:hypothetical protein